jgi:hypothetical protein
MPVFDEDTREKIVLLRGLRTLRTPIEGPYEIVKIEWPSLTDTKYYSTMPIDEVASVAPPVEVEVRLIPEDGDSFLPVSIDSTIGDEEIELEFWDNDDAISDLVVEHGEGIKVTLLNWFPQVELLLPIWEGHLRADDEGDVTNLKLKSVQGFRSSEASVPSRAHYQFCQRIFGGVLTTQEEIDEHGCNYNKHIGGLVGTDDPETSDPWTFCPRRDTGDCVTRGIDPRRHMSHKTIVTTAVNNQTSGPRLLSTSIGNETNLTEPVRVFMGTRRAHGMPVMVFARDLNNNTPEHGWFRAFYEGGEGPVGSIWGARITVGGVTQNAVAIHYGSRLGNVQDGSPDSNLTTHGFSSTWFIRYNFGWVDPTAVGPEDASADAMTNGLRDIRVYGSAVAGQNGIRSIYYNDLEWTSVFGERVEAMINDPSQVGPPLEGMPANAWSRRSLCQIKARYSETYTFYLTHDDGVRLIVGGTTVIDQLPILGSHSGTKAMSADLLTDMQLDFYQGDAPGNHPWYCRLEWESASQARQVIPPDRFFLPDDVDQTVIKQTTSNRVWQIARIVCDKRWGHGYDYAKLAIPSWIESAAWIADYVRFIDPVGTVWDHQRGMSDVELIERKIQQQVEDMCIAGRLSRPYLFDGQLHISPLRTLTEDELDACPEFTDEGDDRNIIQDEIEDGVWKSTLRWSRKSDLDLPNKIECTYDSAADDYKKTPLQPVEDIDAQLRAGRVVGDKSRKVNVKKYHLLGVTNEAHAMKVQWAILDLGPLDEGGLANNLKLTFKIWFLDAIDLHMSKVIKVTSSRITKYGFTHFRILKMERSSKLHYELEVQAYPHEYMETFEQEFSSFPEPPDIPDPDHPPTDPPGPCILHFGSVSFANGVLDVPIEVCNI